MSKTTMLGESQITRSAHDTITVELVEPADLTAFVQGLHRSMHHL
jgi:hypothetical protein